MTAQENHLQQMLVTLRTRLLVMCATVGLALDDACKALDEGDTGRASAVIDGDASINALENEIDEKVLSLLARTQPVAGDLRFVVSALRMVVDLERIGDEASAMAERTLLMQGMDLRPVMPEMRQLMNITRDLYSDAVAAFRDQDKALALKLRAQEDEADLMEVRIMQKLILDTSAASDVQLDPQLALHIILITRALNRVWRRAINMAEHTYFIAEGLSLKHKIM